MAIKKTTAKKAETKDSFNMKEFQRKGFKKPVGFKNPLTK
jgi:hypothetical protein